MNELFPELHKEIETMEKLANIHVETERLGKAKSIKKAMNYRESFDKSKCCKTCGNHDLVASSIKIFYKCKIIGYTHGTATDIRLKDVCDKWEQEQ